MADNINFQFDFSPHGEYQPYSGDGGRDVLAQDGDFHVQLVKLTPEFTKKKADGSGGYPAVKVNMVVTDDDEKGKRLIKDVLCGGKDKNGNDLGRQFLDLLISAGITTTEKVHANAQKKAQMDIGKLCEMLLNKTAIAEVVAGTYDGEDTSDVNNFVAPEQYQKHVDQKSIRKARKPVKITAQQQAAAAGFNVGGGGAPAGGQPNGATTTTPAASGSSVMPEL